MGKRKEAKAKVASQYITVKDKKTAKVLAKVILELSKVGCTIDMILLDLDIRHSEWEMLYKKYKVIRQAVADGERFRIAYGQGMLMKMASGKKSHSNTLSKLFMENIFSITENKGNGGLSSDDAARRARSSYTVVTKMSKEKAQTFEVDDEE